MNAAVAGMTVNTVEQQISLPERAARNFICCLFDRCAACEQITILAIAAGVPPKFARRSPPMGVRKFILKIPQALLHEKANSLKVVVAAMELRK